LWPEHTKEAQRVNGTTPKHTEVVALGQSQTTEPEKQKEGLVEDVTGWPKSYANEGTMEVGTSS
jgi:hypothetical protein